MPKNLAEWSYELHSICIQMVSDTTSGDIKAALICGHYDRSPQFSDFWFVGLAHLLVISGAHICYIESSIRKLCLQLRCPQGFISLLFLSLFALITNGSPPVMRALSSWFCRNLSLKYSLNWPSPFICLASGTICLCLKPEWWLSQSLILSWLATLFLSLPTRSFWLPLCLLYTALIPFTWTWGYTPHPMSIVLNVLISPLFLGILLPLSFLSVLLSPLESLYSDLWSLFLEALHLFSNSFPGTPHKSQQFHLIYFWIYLFFLQWGAYWLHIHLKRQL